jgi:predicted kinase
MVKTNNGTMMNKELYIVRGLPGSGKSTFASSLTPNHWESDMYFINEYGEYKFNPDEIKNAHQWCRDMVEGAMKHNLSKIAVSNTFTQEWEMKPYHKLAELYGYKVFHIVVENRHGGVNIHNVPEEVFYKMKMRFEINL